MISSFANEQVVSESSLIPPQYKGWLATYLFFFQSLVSVFSVSAHSATERFVILSQNIKSLILDTDTSHLLITDTNH